MSLESRRRWRRRVCALCAFVGALAFSVTPARGELPGYCEETIAYCVAFCTWSLCPSWNYECPLIGGGQSQCNNTMCDEAPWPYKQYITCTYGPPE